MATKIGFLSFNHWQDVRGSRVRTAQDSLLQSIDLAVAAEEIGIDGAYFRVHHFAPQQAAPFPLLAAIASRTSRIEIGTGVVDMRYENPLYMAEEAAMTDLISNRRVQLGISRGSPEQVEAGYESFGYVPQDGETDADMARRHTGLFLRALEGEELATAAPQRGIIAGGVAITPQSPGLRERIWWGAGTRATGQWAAEQGMNLMSSTLLSEDTGVPLDVLQAEQIQLFRDGWAAAGHAWEPRVSVSRSIIPIVDDESEAYFGVRSQIEGKDQVGQVGGEKWRFGRSYIGTPERLIEELGADQAIAAADTLLVTIPNQLGVDFNLRSLAAIKGIGEALGYDRADVAVGASA
ncbi:LLM class flavin-dependent oxidoreductase [Clavibacter tessellarius]|uniref:LLM class flavin-dependent oxidoreductase n=1 Tax=Clavibacter tessellarius TaxID=31965 RepID=UPI0039EBE9F6